MFFVTLFSTAYAVDLDLNDPDSIHSATHTIASGVLDYYDGSRYGGTIGVMSPPYYWWQSASAFNGLLNYGLITGDHQYDDIVHESLMAQCGDNWDFITANQSNVEGNDDQGYWAMLALEAAERDFKAPSNGKSWISIAQSVFDQMVTRWDPQCGGGLRWQIFDWNHGYNYKNSVSTGCMFNIAARLAHYTNNQTYVDWSYKIYEWMVDVKFITLPSAQSVYHIYDGAGTETNCQGISTAEWSYNYGAFLSGMAYLHDLLEDTNTWSDRISINWARASKIFFDSSENSAMIEPSCQPQGQCNNDQRSFRAPFSRFLGHLMIFVPDYRRDVEKLLVTNAGYAAKSCSGGSDGVTCGQDWSKNGWDGVYGLGEQMAALEVILGTQFQNLGAPGTNPGDNEKPSEPSQYAPKSSSASASQSSSSSSFSTQVVVEATANSEVFVASGNSAADGPSAGLFGIIMALVL